MAGAWLLTGLALAGLAAGLILSRDTLLRGFIAAAGGILLLVIAFFRLLPEIAEAWGIPLAFAAIIAVSAVLWFLDKGFFHHHDLSRLSVLIPLLFAMAIHSTFDGWAARGLTSRAMPGSLLALTGLALHKVPEGLGLGLVLRRSLHAPWKAAVLGAGVELLTLVGALIQPAIDRSGFSRFGPAWEATVLAIIAGIFVFLGVHSVTPLSVAGKWFTRKSPIS